MLCITLIVFKSSKDVLQGISKLDYLIKVSCFQMYKDKNLEFQKNQRIESFYSENERVK